MATSIWPSRPSNILYILAMINCAPPLASLSLGPARLCNVVLMNVGFALWTSSLTWYDIWNNRWIAMMNYIILVMIYDIIYHFIDFNLWLKLALIDSIMYMWYYYTYMWYNMSPQLYDMMCDMMYDILYVMIYTMIWYMTWYML